MRITAAEKSAIKTAILSLDKEARIYLYGSRTNDNLKGGDIDLLVISEFLSFSDKIDILSEIKHQIGEQKIDLSIKKQSEVVADPFFKSVLPNAEKL